MGTKVEVCDTLRCKIIIKSIASSKDLFGLQTFYNIDSLFYFYFYYFTG